MYTNGPTNTLKSFLSSLHLKTLPPKTTNGFYIFVLEPFLSILNSMNSYVFNWNLDPDCIILCAMPYCYNFLCAMPDDWLQDIDSMKPWVVK